MYVYFQYTHTCVCVCVHLCVCVCVSTHTHMHLQKFVECSVHIQQILCQGGTMCKTAEYYSTDDVNAAHRHVIMIIIIIMSVLLECLSM